MNKTTIDQNLLFRLMRIPSVSHDIPRVNDSVNCLRAYLEEHGVPCVEEALNGRKILYASTLPGKVQDVLFNAHLDVVPAAPEQFEPRLDEATGRLYGRGGADCKGNAAVIVQLLLDNLGKASLGAVFSTDEEIGGFTAAEMVRLGYGARKMVVIIDASAYKIANAQKGVVSFRLRALGHGGHSSRPWEFDNPIDRLMDAYARIRVAWKVDESAPGHWYDSVAATMLRAGEAHNQIPDTAEMILNVRFTEPDGAERAERLFREAAGEGVEVTHDPVSPPVFCDENHPEMQRLLAAMRRAWPEKNPCFYRMMGATDSRHFVSLGVPIAIIGTMGGAVHEPGEWALYENFNEVLVMLEAYLSGQP